MIFSVLGSGFLFAAEADSVAKSCLKTLKPLNTVSFEFSADKEKEIIQFADNYLADIMDNKFNKPSIYRQTMKRVYTHITGRLFSKNPNTYLFYYFNQGVPQRLRYVLKVGLTDDVSGIQKELDWLGVKQENLNLEKRKVQLAGGLRAISETYEIAQSGFSSMINMVRRYESLETDLRFLVIQARLKQHQLTTLNTILENPSAYVFPMRLKLTDSFRWGGEFESSFYKYDSTEQVRDHINTLSNLDFEFFGDYFKRGVFLKGRLIEQAFIRGYMYVLKEELKKFSHATGYSSVREALLERVNTNYYNEKLTPPLFATLEHFLEELKWEAHRYTGGGVASSVGEEANSLLRQNDVYDLGLNSQRMTLLQKLKRFAILSAPIQAAAIVATLATPILVSEVEDIILDSQKKAVISASAEEYPKALRLYLQDKAKLSDDSYLLPSSEWPEEARELFSEVAVLRAEYTAKQKQTKYAEENVSTRLTTLESKNKQVVDALEIVLAKSEDYRKLLLEKYLANEKERDLYLEGSFYGAKFGEERLSTEFLILINIRQRTKELKAEEKTDPQIYLAIYHEFVSLVD